MAEVNPAGPKDMGRVVKAARAALAGKTIAYAVLVVTFEYLMIGVAGYARGFVDEALVEREV